MKLSLFTIIFFATALFITGCIENLNHDQNSDLNGPYFAGINPGSAIPSDYGTILNPNGTIAAEEPVVENAAEDVAISTITDSVFADDKVNGSVKKMNIAVSGKFKRYTAPNITESDPAIYYFEDGKAVWNYSKGPDEDERCVLSMKTGSGTVDLTNPNDGHFEIDSTGKYFGTIVNQIVKVEVKKSLRQAKSYDPTECDGVRAEDLAPTVEEIFLDIYIEGTSANSTNIVGEHNGIPNENSIEETKTSWNLQLPN